MKKQKGAKYIPVICRVCGEIDEGNPCWKCIRDLQEIEAQLELEKPAELMGNEPNDTDSTKGDKYVDKM